MQVRENFNMAKSIMIQGTMSNVGKSLLAGGLCRVLKEDGIRVAPFKSQNMALNSFITADGLEMGRAQVMQAEAAMIQPEVYMNPILLKPTSDVGSQVIVNGEVAGVMPAMEYFRKKKEYIPAILEAYHKLDEKYDVIVIEGAGSPAEINLKQNDIVNMGLAELVDAPVLLVGDIDRGGVFAQIVGTVMLLEEKERARIKGTVINKFRGDVKILEPGIRMLEDRTKIPVCGVMPYIYADIDDEDSLSERFDRKEKAALLDIAVIRLPRISNFTDFAVLECREEVSLRYVSKAGDFGNPDLVILPGSKNTMEDLLWLRQSGLEGKVLRHASSGKPVFGICGGYQMLGEEICDPEGVERGGTIKAMGLLPAVTVFENTKRRTRVTGKFGEVTGILKAMSGAKLDGYEIHMGETIFSDKDAADHKMLVQICDQVTDESRWDGAQKKNVYGCYVHGIFDDREVADALIGALLKEKGYEPSIHDFSMMDMSTGDDITEDVLTDMGYTFLLVAHRIEEADDSNIDLINEIYDYSVEHGYKFYCLTSSPEEQIELWKDKTGAEYPFCQMDDITLKTMVRSNPGLILIKNGTILNKWSDEDIPDEYVLTDKLENLPLGKQKVSSDTHTVGYVFLWFVIPLLLVLGVDVLVVRRRERKNAKRKQQEEEMKSKELKTENPKIEEQE